MTTCEQARDMAISMMSFGNAQPLPSLKKAVWTAILSANNALERNAAQVGVLTPYVRLQQLPHRPHDVQEIISWSDWRPPILHCEAIIRAELIIDYDMSGMGSMLSRKPTTGREWVTWRREMVRTFKGISWKTASFAALLMWPLDCPFAVVDRHILRRYHKSHLAAVVSRKSRTGYLAYRSVERLVARQRGEFNTGLKHWAEWQTQRNTAFDCHDLLSPYAY